MTAERTAHEEPNEAGAPTDIRSAALEALSSGASIVWVAEDGSKKPLGGGSWKNYQKARVTEMGARKWFSGTKTGLGVVTGAVSGNLELFEFDDLATYEQFWHKAQEDDGLFELVSKVANGYEEFTPGGGVHWFWRCNEIGGNTKLARRPKAADEMKDEHDRVKVLIETRGEGGFAVVAPSHGKVHQTGKPYVLNRGGWDTVVELTAEERATLLDFARTFDQLPKPEYRLERMDTNGSSVVGPWTDYNKRGLGGWHELLSEHGWELDHNLDEVEYWRRPGKEEGCSASLGHVADQWGNPALYVFTSSTEFESNRSYDLFGALAILEHDGDFASAAKAIRAQKLNNVTLGDTEDQTREETGNWIPIQYGGEKSRVRPPYGYQVERDGVYKIDEYGERTRIATAACLPVAILRDDEGEELVVLSWFHYGKGQHRVVPRSIVKSGRKLVGYLGDFGFPITDASATSIEIYLNEFEAFNKGQLIRRDVARRLGWQNDGEFVVGNRRPREIRPTYGGLEQQVEAHSPSGELADWQKVVLKAQDYPMAMMPVFASLAAPLLKVLGRKSFTLDLCGQTTTGKTTAAELGLSAWANPKDAMAFWNSTRVGIERRLSLANGVPVVIDETSTRSYDRMVNDVLFSIEQGHEKMRGSTDGMRHIARWNTMVITTGEQPIVSYDKTAAGTLGRVVTLPGSPFGSDGGDAAIAVREGCYQFYGTAGPTFIQALRSRLTPEYKMKLEERHKVLTEAFAVGSNVQRRRAPLIALIRLAAELATEYGVIPFPVYSSKIWEQLFIPNDPSADDRPKEALECVWDFIAANPHRFVGADSSQYTMDGKWAGTDIGEVPHQGWAGKYIEGTDLVAVAPAVVDDVLSKAGFSLEAVKDAWKARGFISTPDKGTKKVVRVEGRSVKWFAFDPAARESEEAVTTDG